MDSSSLLSDDCWEMTIKRLNVKADQHHLRQLSLISKQLLSVTNQLLECLKIFDRTKFSLPTLIRRFPNLKKFDLSDAGEDISVILYYLAHSNLNLQGLDLSNQKILPLESLRELAKKKMNIQILKCSRLLVLRDAELIAVGRAFPLLEELDISYPSYASAVTDDSIKALSTILPKLAKINLSGNVTLSDECLIALSKNCDNLREAVLHHCGGITEDGVAFLVQNRPTLSSLSLGLTGGFSQTFNVSLAGLRFLNTLEFYYMQITDHFLFKIADAKFPLKRFALCHCKKFSTAGLVYFLHTYRSLESICLAEIDFLDDNYLNLFSQFLQRMTIVTLNCCPKLTEESFITLICACPRLQRLGMAKTGLWDPSASLDFRGKLNFLNLSGGLRCWEDKMRRIASLCPNLTHLDLSGCLYVSESIIAILEIFKNIRHLKINGCPDIAAVEGTQMFERLEILQAVGSGMSDRSLCMFARRSPALRCLNLKNCGRISAGGVAAVVERCRNLNEINIMDCNIDLSFVNWMFYRQPLLRHVVPPYDVYSPFRQQSPFLRIECSYCSN